MNFKYKKHCILILSLLLSFIGVSQYIISSKNTPENQFNKTNSDNNLYKDLIKNKSWQNISIYWKKLNGFKPQQDHKNTFKLFENSEKELLLVEKNIANLKTDGLINDQEKEYLLKLFKQRLGYLQYAMGIVECYKMTSLGSKIAETRGDLEKRYDTIQKLYSENKINSEVFKATSKQITQDLKFIDDNLKDQEATVNQNIINLVIYLNQ
ncbi:MAG: hypothetical protein AB1782_18980 [Cyanobacteriota bacterium]